MAIFKTIGWMITQMILARFIFILIGLCLFVITLELVTYSGQILELKNDEISALGEYALLLFPVMIAAFTALSLLLAVLLSLVELSYRNEITALWSAGLSPLRVIIMLLPLGALIGGFNFLINDQAVPRVTPQLHEWGIGEYSAGQLNIGENSVTWMRAGNDILKAGKTNKDATFMSDVTIFRRDDRGVLIEQILADRASLKDGRWFLEDVAVYYQQNIAPNRLERLIYSGSLRPAVTEVRSGDPKEMTLQDLSYFIENAGFGIRPVHVYTTWWHKRFTLLITSWLMIAVCIPLAVYYRRGGGIGLLFGVGIAIGFAFFVFDGISLSIGELGLTPAWMAAWTPALVLAGLATTLCLRAETTS